MKIIFDDIELEKLYLVHLENIKGKQRFSLEVIKQFKKKVAILITIDKLDDLRPFKGLNFEFLKGDRNAQCSIRLNDQFRLIFVPTREEIIQVLIILEISKHYE